MADEIKKTIFGKFVNLYEFSKTLQFGLIPLRYDEDKKTLIEDCEFTALKERGIIEKDEQIAKNIRAAKFYLDILHREFIDEALGRLKFKDEYLKEIYHILSEIEKNKKDKIRKKELNKQLLISKDTLLDEVQKTFAEENKNLQDKYSVEGVDDNVNILLSKNALEVLQKKFTKRKVEKLRKENLCKELIYPDVTYLDPGGNERSVFEMNAGYLDDFHKNRKLLYSIGNKKGSLGRRIVDNYVDTFCKNRRIFKEKYEKSKIDFSAVEINFGVKLEQFFKFENYNACISQSDIEEYNKILGGESRKQERKENIEGLNQIINLYCQQKENEHKKEQGAKQGKKTKFNKKDYPFFLPLQKQILAQILRKEILIENDHDLIRELKFFIEKSEEKIKKAQEIIDSFYEKKGLDLTKTYLPKNKINSFAYKVFKEPQDFISFFREGKSILGVMDFGKVQKYLEENQPEYKDFFKEVAGDRKGFDAFLHVWKHEFDTLIKGGKTVVKGGKKKKVESIASKQEELKKWLKWFEDKVKKNEKMTDEDEGLWCSAVLSYSQAVLDITKRTEIFWLNEKQAAKISEEDKDPTFYPLFERFANDDFVPFFYFDKFRNYLNRRSRNTAKGIKLYFNNDHLLDGWDINKETAFCGFLFRERHEYYLGIGQKNAELFHNNKGKEVQKAYKIEDDDFYEKIEYKQLDIGKFEGIAFPKKTKSKENFKKALKERAEEFLGGNIAKLKEFLGIKKEYDKFKEERQKNKAWDRKFDIEKIRQLIAYYITCLKTRDEWKRFNLEFKNIEDYADRDDFVVHVQRQAYWIKPERVSKKYLYEKVANGELFLFRIHTKDFDDFEKKLSDNNLYKTDQKPSKMNLFTHYFLELFSDENIANIQSKDLSKSIFELDGKAEIRFRRMTDRVRQKPYKKNGKILMYTDKRDGGKRKEVLQHRRFTKNALILHLKTRLNFGKHIDLREFNEFMNTKLLTQVPVQVVGFDRGENNLIYFCVLNENGEIKRCGSLNKVGEHIKKLSKGKTKREPTDYYRLLVEREEQRDWERKNWQKVTPIKDLKEGYLGNIKNWIIKEALGNLDQGLATLNVLEDLSGNFKRTRFFRERQVYQNFEKELIDKLNYVVDKDRGNYGQAYQFTPVISSVEEMEKNRQIGSLVYVPAGFTSKICPKCGWRKKLNIKNSETKEKIVGTPKKKGLLELGIIKIFYEKEHNRFCFKYKWEQEYNNDGKKEKYGGIDKVFSNMSRSRWDNSTKKTIEFKDNTDGSITNRLKTLFSEVGVSISDDINQQLIERRDELKLEFFRSIIFYLNLIMQIRNYDRSKKGADADYIQCPAEKNGKMCLFDSRKSAGNGKLKKVTDGDANGAYNIARKGLILLWRIRENTDTPNLFINNKDYDGAVSEWDKFTQEQWKVTSKYPN
ncbi:MAG: hypothetical protein ABIG08_01325 [bacterium]